MKRMKSRRREEERERERGGVQTEARHLTLAWEMSENSLSGINLS